jgi:hypothetical protein
MGRPNGCDGSFGIHELIIMTCCSSGGLYRYSPVLVLVTLLLFVMRMYYLPFTALLYPASLGDHVCMH